MEVLRLGHAMYMLTSKEDKRYLIDPFFEMNPGCPSEYLQDSFLKTIDVVFLTNGHFDHVSGLKAKKAANPNVMVVANMSLQLSLCRKECKIFFQ